MRPKPCTCRTVAGSLTLGLFWFTGSLLIRRSQVVHGGVRLGVFFLTLLQSPWALEAPSCVNSERTVNSERVRRDEEAATGA